MKIAMGWLALIMAAAIPAGAQQVYKPGDGVTLPVAEKQAPPHYTPEAMDARIEGAVILDCVVRENGSVSDVKVSQSLDSKFGLDAEAVRALGQWAFKPGTREGKAVAVAIAVEMTFTLK